ncbi:fanconi-associated nuclease 1-like [Babylonia areolata]|uniref:fanconi-associated nuclease 1-like n=1 Tax=Babylonia areolata TaxID=304850 RepID=UPI003FD11FD0
MSSKGSAGKRNKGKKMDVSSPKKPVMTVTALFKKQLLQQQAKNQGGKNSADQDSDNEAIEFVQEEQKSVYFSPPKSQNRSLRKDVNEGEDCGDLSKKPAHSKDLLGTEKRLSRRLSLRKASQERKIAEEAKNQDNSASAAVVCNQSVKGSSDQSKSASSSEIDCGRVSISGPSCLIAEQSSSNLEKKTTISDTATASVTSPTDTSSKGKLSLKRKQTSQDGPSSSHSPKVPMLENKNKTLENRAGGTPSSATDKVRSSATPVFSVFRQPSESALLQGHTGPKSAASVIPQDLETTQKDSAESLTTSTSTSTSRTNRLNKEAKVKDGIKSKNEVKGEANDLQTSELDSEAAGEGTSENKEDGAENGKEETLFRVPYYLENFSTIVKSVFADDYYVQLFNEADLHFVEEYNNLSEPSKKLFVRLFSRKRAWLPTTKIKYPEIAENLVPCLEELVTANLLSSGEQLDDLDAILGAMSAPDLRTLAKSYHVNLTGQQKGQIIQTLVSKSRHKTVASHFGQKIGGVKMAMLKRAKSMLGPVYQLCREVRAVFVRAMMLFSLINTSGDDDNSGGGQGQLFQMLLVNIGRVVYPAYTVNRHTRIFRNRQDLIRFEEALQLEAELLGNTASGNWRDAYTSFLAVKECYDQLEKDPAIRAWDSKLPAFLRYYTAGSVLVRLMNQGIEILQRRKEYPVAVSLIRELLAQTVYNGDLHGYWWDRLALNLDVHLKRPEQALQAIEDGLADPLVRTGHRLSLFLRAETICSKPKSPFRQRLKRFVHEPLVELPKTFVEGRILPHTLPGSRYQFITNTSSEEADDAVTMCNVEQIVLDYYRVNGFPQGIHAEGSVVSTLFCLYFWEALFMDVTDAFHSPYQSSPLDFHTDAFYQRRQKTIDERLAVIESSDEETLRAMVALTWEGQHGAMCAGINWDRFSSVGEVQGLVSCMGGRVLSGILRRYAQQPRHTRGGFPDLTLWNTCTKQLKICEVKGPGDRLSHKQMLWLDHLLKLGVDAEVCHVKPVGVKKLKPQSSQEPGTV